MVTETVILPTSFVFHGRKSWVWFNMFMGEVYLQFKYGIIYMVPMVMKYKRIVQLFPDKKQ